MRLRMLDGGHRLRQRIALTIIRLASRTAPDPVAKVSLYRPELFGSRWLQLVESVMRGPSEWSEAERELLGAFVSRLNHRPFCVGIHTGIAEHRLHARDRRETRSLARRRVRPAVDGDIRLPRRGHDRPP